MNKSKAYSYVRWSHPSQTLGDSEKRQVEEAALYCSRHDLDFQQTFKDRGVSAKAGKNRETGSAFSQMLNFVGAGDSILVEDMDRFSREDPLTGMNALREILKHKKCFVVFLKEGITVSTENFMDDSIIIPLFMKAFLGYRENTKKGERVSKAWKSKKADIQKGKVVRTKSPCWLDYRKIDDAKGEFVIDESRAKIVRRMFDLCISGKGSGEITSILNKEKVPLITKQKHSRNQGYNQRFVLNCLTEKYVIGVKKLLMDDGSFKEIPNYYPAVVTEKVFYSAQKAIGDRKVFRGTKSQDHNLFSRLCNCAQCGQLLFKHSCHKDAQYLICGGAKVGMHGYSSINLKWFEYSFIDVLIQQEAFILQLVSGKEKPSKVGELKGRIAIQEKKVESIAADYEKNPSSRLAEIMSKAEQEIAELKATLDKERATEYSHTPFDETLDAILNKTVLEVTTNPTIENRIQLREQIRAITDKIVVDMKGEKYSIFFKGAKKPVDVGLTRAGVYTVNGVTVDLAKTSDADQYFQQVIKL